jgi:flavoprotein
MISSKISHISQTDVSKIDPFSTILSISFCNAGTCLLSKLCSHVSNKVAKVTTSIASTVVIESSTEVSDGAESFVLSTSEEESSVSSSVPHSSSSSRLSELESSTTACISSPSAELVLESIILSTS